MLERAQLVVNLRASDLDEAVSFYEGKLGLPVAIRAEALPGHEEVLFDAGGGLVCIEQGTPADSGGQTPAGFQVEDVPGTVDALRAAGVTFEDYDLPSLKTVDGVATVGSLQAAWFKDPAGNLLALTSPLKSS
jgi:catechol 2,3-dioxygenase-like lactoylglutathione lyase family enzyme